MKKTVATLTVTVDHIRERFGPRAGLDPDGVVLLHEAANLAAVLQGSAGHPMKRSDFAELVDRVARLDVNAKMYIAGLRLSRVAERLPHSMRPNDEAQAQMAEALAGPKGLTLTECPACLGCTLCLDARLVTPAIATEYELRNTPRRDRRTMIPLPHRPRKE